MLWAGAAVVLRCSGMLMQVGMRGPLGGMVLLGMAPGGRGGSWAQLPVLVVVSGGGVVQGVLVGTGCVWVSEPAVSVPLAAGDQQAEPRAEGMVRRGCMGTCGSAAWWPGAQTCIQATWKVAEGM